MAKLFVCSTAAYAVIASERRRVRVIDSRLIGDNDAIVEEDGTIFSSAYSSKRNFRRSTLQVRMKIIFFNLFVEP